MGKLVASYKRRFGFPETVLNDDNAELVFQLWREETLPRHLSFFDAALSRSATPWLVGTKGPTIADVFLATTLSAYAEKWPDWTPPYSSKVQAVIDGIHSHPAVVEFCAASP